MHKALVVAASVVATGCGADGGEPPAPAPAPLAASDEIRTSPRNCIQLELAPLKVVRADEGQRRLFVVAAAADERPLAARIRDLESCFELTDWAGRWSLSVFADESLARYKDDPQVADAVKDGRWSRAYVAEFDAGTKRLTRNPAGAP